MNKVYEGGGISENSGRDEFMYNIFDILQGLL
jgi:hypothetical protein